MNDIVTQVVGIVAGTGTTVSFVPQVYQIVKTRKTENISPIMFCIHTTGVSLWVVYGILEDNYIIILFNVIALKLCLTILCFMLIEYRKKTQTTLDLIEINS